MMKNGTGATPRQRGRSEDRLSIVVALFNDAGNVIGLHEHIVEIARRLKATRGLAIEVVYVDDGSRDGTLAAAQGTTPTASTSR
jgi:glycosyltransferase involved in cell wall biosynthesis